MSGDQYRQIIRWFETLSGKFEEVTKRLDRQHEQIAAIQSEVHETRELMAQLRDDDLVQRQAIANLARRLDAV